MHANFAGWLQGIDDYENKNKTTTGDEQAIENIDVPLVRSTRLYVRIML